MAEHGILIDAYISINAVDLSDHLRSLRVPQEVEGQDDTVMGDTTRSEAGGLKRWTIDAEFNQDFAAGEVDATLNAALGTVVAIEVRPSDAVVGATNPKWTGNALVAAYEPIAGAVGDMAIARCTLRNAGTLTRATA